MSDKTGIEWTDATWNPTVGCTEVSAGCDHCYAETLVNRFAGHNKAFPNRFDVMTLRDDKTLTLPLRWTKPKRVFVNSLSDLFHDDVSDEFIAEVFAVMALADRHTFQLLTKRHGRLRALLNDGGFKTLVAKAAIRRAEAGSGSPAMPTRLAMPPEGQSWWPLPNVWLGVSVENQQWADIRIPALIDTPAAVRFLSCEPLLGPVDLEAKCNAWGRTWLDRIGAPGVDWVIVGGESGPGARPMHPQWARDIRGQCVDAGVPFLFKQWGAWLPRDQRAAALADWSGKAEWLYPDGTVSTGVLSDWSKTGGAAMFRVGKKAAGRELDGRTWDEYPAARQAVAS